MLISKCCNTKLTVINGNEGTSYYECTKCSKPSDPRVSIDLSAFDSQEEKDGC